MISQTSQLTRIFVCLGLAVPLVLSGCQSAPPRLTGTLPTYFVSGAADHKDFTTGPPASYSKTGQAAQVGVDGNSFAFSVPISFDQLIASSQARFGLRTADVPSAETSDQATSQFTVNPAGANARIGITASAMVYLSSGAGASFSWTVNVRRLLPNVIVASYAGEYRFRPHPRNPNQIRVLTGPRGGTPTNQFANGSTILLNTSQPGSTFLIPDTYVLEFNLDTQSDGEQAIIISNAKVNL